MTNANTSSFAQDQAELYLQTDGREGGEMRGRPIVVVTTTGARSGTPRLVPVMRVEHDGSYGVVASKGGAPAHPSWYHNLVAHPRVTLQDGAVRHEYLARELDGAEREAWWVRAVQAWPDYATYQTKTERLIPVFVLDPVEESATTA